MEFHSEQKAGEGAVAEQATANSRGAEADAELLKKYKEFWACPTMGVDPELAQADPEQLKMDRETVNERAATNAEEAKADAELSKKQKEFWSLHRYLLSCTFHCCSMRDIFSVLQFFNIEGTEGRHFPLQQITHAHNEEDTTERRACSKLPDTPSSKSISTNFFTRLLPQPSVPLRLWAENRRRKQVVVFQHSFAIGLVLRCT